jgi:Flp pilus assembly protein TadG
MVRCKRDERGAAAVEFAILLPLLLLLVFGIVEFSILYNHKQGLHAAAREGARVAALPTSSTSDIEDRVRDALEGVLDDPSAATITVTPSNCDSKPSGTAIKVNVAATDDFDVPLFTEKVDLTGEGEFRCE